MSTIKSSNEHLTFNADGSSRNILFQANGTQKASISSAGLFTSTTIDATVLTGNLPAISGASLTGVTDSAALPKAGGTMTGNIAHGGAFTIDAVGDISLDSEGAILIKNGGSAIGRISNSSSDMIIKSDTSDKDILFKGSDDGSTITALTLDMSEAGYATFNNWIKVNDRVVGNSNLVLNTSDGNEKIHLDASGYIKFETGGVEVMRVNSTGNRLHVKGHTGSLPSIFESNGNGDTVPLQLKVKANNGTTSTQGLYGAAGSAAANNYITLGNSETSGVIVNNSGNVGIGTTSPASARGISGAVLHILDTPDAALRITDTGGSDFEISAETNTSMGTVDATDLIILSNNAERMRIDSSGKVGIGRVPAALLHLQAAVPEIRFTYTGNSGYAYIKGNDNSELIFSTGTTDGQVRMKIDSVGNVAPGADGTQDLGYATLRWANIYTGDLHLANTEGNDVDGTTGDWTIQEGDENLYIKNNKTGKKYKFKLEEIQ